VTPRPPPRHTLAAAVIATALAIGAALALGCAKADTTAAVEPAAPAPAVPAAAAAASADASAIAEGENGAALYVDEDGPLPNDKGLPVINDIDDDGHFICPVKQIPIVDTVHARSAEYDGFYVYLACPGAKRRFMEDPEGFVTGKRLPMKRCGDGECEYRKALAKEGKTPEGLATGQSEDASAPAKAEPDAEPRADRAPAADEAAPAR
jgi:hypothetical protein